MRPRRARLANENGDDLGATKRPRPASLVRGAGLFWDGTIRRIDALPGARSAVSNFEDHPGSSHGSVLMTRRAPFVKGARDR